MGCCFCSAQRKSASEVEFLGDYSLCRGLFLFFTSSVLGIWHVFECISVGQQMDILLAVVNDPSNYRLASALIRRLGNILYVWGCCRLKWPKGLIEGERVGGIDILVSMFIRNDVIDHSKYVVLCEWISISVVDCVNSFCVPFIITSV